MDNLPRLDPAKPTTPIEINLTNPQKLLLLTILALALLLRLWGINFGLPYAGSYDDEIFLTDNALYLLRQNQWDLSKWDIGNAQIYLQAIIGQIVFALKGFNPAEVPTYGEIILANQISAAAVDVPYPAPEFYLWGRASVAFLGGFSVVILFLIGRAVKSSRVGLISAFFLAASSLHAEHSHYLTRTAPGLFFLLLAFYVTLQAYFRRNWWLYLLSLPLAYLAIYIKQNNLIILAPLSLAVAASTGFEFKSRPRREILRYLGFIIAGVVVISSLSYTCCQFSLLDYAHYIFNRIFRNAYVFGGYQFGYSGGSAPRWLIEQLFTGPRADWRLVNLLALPGILLALQLRDKSWLLFTVLVPYLLMMFFFTVRFENWLIPILPVLSILAALSLDWGYERLNPSIPLLPRYRQALLGLIVILIPLPSIRAIITLNYYTGQPDVRQVAAAWMQSNLPPGSKIVIDSWGPYLDHTRHEPIYTLFIGDKDLETYRQEQVDYLVVNSMSLSRFITAGQPDPQAGEIVASRTARMSQIMGNLPLEQEFVGPALLNLPVINVLVYKLK